MGRNKSAVTCTHTHCFRKFHCSDHSRKRKQRNYVLPAFSVIKALSNVCRDQPQKQISKRKTAKPLVRYRDHVG